MLSSEIIKQNNVFDVNILYFLTLKFFKYEAAQAGTGKVHHNTFWVFNIMILNELSSEPLNSLKMPTNGYWLFEAKLDYI